MKTLGQAYHILLSGPQAEFKERSVNYAGAHWGERFQTVLDSAKSVEEASSHHPADNSVAYWYASRLLSCRALLQAQQLNLDLVALAVWNGKPGFGRGGTASFIEFWNSDFHKPFGQTKPKLEIIRLDSLLRDQGPIQEITTEPAIHLDPAAGTDSNVQQDFRAILVGNVVGFENLTEEQLPLFHEHFLGAAARLLNSTRDAPMAVKRVGKRLFYHISRSRPSRSRRAAPARKPRSSAWRYCGMAAVRFAGRSWYQHYAPRWSGLLDV
jgi:hypothetical protein